MYSLFKKKNLIKITLYYIIVTLQCRCNVNSCAITKNRQALKGLLVPVMKFTSLRNFASVRNANFIFFNFIFFSEK